MDGLLSSMCAAALKPITADGSCGAGWLAGRERTEAGGRSVAQLAAEDPQPLSLCLLRRGQWDKRPLQITRDEQRRRFYWTLRRFFLHFLPEVHLGQGIERTCSQKQTKKISHILTFVALFADRMKKYLNSLEKLPLRICLSLIPIVEIDYYREPFFRAHQWHVCRME